MTLFSPSIPPNATSTRKLEVRVVKSQFGDGYEQRLPDGANAQRVVWELSWNVLTTAQADAIEAALMAGVFTSFTYTVPGDVQRSYKVESSTYQRSGVGPLHDEVRVTIKQVF